LKAHDRMTEFDVEYYWIFEIIIDPLQRIYEIMHACSILQVNVPDPNIIASEIY